jgi:hypothetical protein
MLDSRFGACQKRFDGELQPNLPDLLSLDKKPQLDLQMELHLAPLWSAALHTGGKGAFTQQVHYESIVSSETIRPVVTHQVHIGFFLKVPTPVPSRCVLSETPGFFFKSTHNNTQWVCFKKNSFVLSKSTHQSDHNVPSGFFSKEPIIKSQRRSISQ